MVTAHLPRLRRAPARQIDVTVSAWATPRACWAAPCWSPRCSAPTARPMRWPRARCRPAPSPPRGAVRLQRVRGRADRRPHRQRAPSSSARSASAGQHGHHALTLRNPGLHHRPPHRRRDQRAVSGRRRGPTNPTIVAIRPPAGPEHGGLPGPGGEPAGRAGPRRQGGDRRSRRRHRHGREVRVSTVAIQQGNLTITVARDARR